MATAVVLPPPLQVTPIVVPCAVNMSRSCGRDKAFHPNLENAVPLTVRGKHGEVLSQAHVSKSSKTHITDMARKLMMGSKHMQRRCKVCNPNYKDDERSSREECCCRGPPRPTSHHVRNVSMKNETGREQHFGYFMKLKHFQGTTQPPLRPQKLDAFTHITEIRISTLSRAKPSSSVSELVVRCDAQLQRLRQQFNKLKSSPRARTCHSVSAPRRPKSAPVLSMAAVQQAQRPSTASSSSGPLKLDLDKVHEISRRTSTWYTSNEDELSNLSGSM